MGPGRRHRRWPSPARLDDHSRYVAALRAGIGHGTAELVWSVMLDRNHRVRNPGNVVGRQRNCLHRPAARVRVSVRGQPARAGYAHHQLHPVASADLRQDRTVLADPEEMAARPTDAPATLDELNAAAGPVPRLLQPPPSAPSATRSHSRRQRSPPQQEPAPADRPLPATGLRQPPHRRRQHSGKLHVAPYRINVGLRWASHYLRRHPSRQPHRHLQRHHAHTRHCIADPTRRHTSPAHPTPGLTARANPNRHHDCQRCPET